MTRSILEGSLSRQCRGQPSFQQIALLSERGPELASLSSPYLNMFQMSLRLDSVAESWSSDMKTGQPYAAPFDCLKLVWLVVGKQDVLDLSSLDLLLEEDSH